MLPQYSRSSQLVWRHTSGGVLVLPVPAGDVVTLSGTGEDVWELLDEPQTVPALAQRLAARYGVRQATVTAELLPVLADLSVRGVLVRTDRP